MAHSIVVQYIYRENPIHNSTSKESCNSSTIKEVDINGWDIVKQKYIGKGFDANVISTLLSSWRKGTKVNYERHLKGWILFCSKHNIDMLKPETSMALKFLQELFDKGKSHSEINTACSALSAVIDCETSFGKIPIVKKFTKEIFESRPSFPKYSIIWDTQKVFNYFRNLPDVDNIGLKLLSQKLVMLLCLLSGRTESTNYSLHLY